MSSLWMRRALLALVSASALLIAACGSGTIESQLQPTRILVFGDGISDLGQGGTRYTVNDGGVNIWTQQVAASFGHNLTSAAAGGTSWARGNVRITGKPDAAGDSATADGDRADRCLPCRRHDRRCRSGDCGRGHR